MSAARISTARRTSIWRAEIVPSATGGLSHLHCVLSRLGRHLAPISSCGGRSFQQLSSLFPSYFSMPILLNASAVRALLQRFTKLVWLAWRTIGREGERREFALLTTSIHMHLTWTCLAGARFSFCSA